MKDQHDCSTPDLDGLPAPKRKRSRPPTGKAMTVAQRKAAQRLRDQQADLAAVTTYGLVERIGRAVAANDAEAVEYLAAILAARIRAKTST